MTYGPMLRCTFLTWHERNGALGDVWETLDVVGIARESLVSRVPSQWRGLGGDGRTGSPCALKQAETARREEASDCRWLWAQ